MRASLADERPRLLAGAKLEKTNEPGVFSLRDPRTGRSHTLRKLDAVVAHSCNGNRNLLELVEMAQKYGSSASPEMISDVVRKLKSLGILEQEAATFELSGADLGPQVPDLASTPVPANAFEEGDGTDEHTQVELKSMGSAPPASAPVALGPASLPAARVNGSSGQIRALESLTLPKVGPSARGSWLPWALLVGVLVAGVGGLLFYRAIGAVETKTEEAPGVRIETLRADTRSGQALVAAGFLSAPNLILIGATMAGRIKEVKVVNGAKVVKNQVLLLLDDTQMLAELQLSRAKLRAVQRARFRTRELFKAEAATQADLDNAVGQAEIATAEASLIEQRLQQTKVRSPIDGTIIEVPVHPGEVITMGDSRPLIKLADLTTLVAEIDVNEADAPMARLEQVVEVQTEAVKGKAFEGTVREISQQVDKARGTVLVKVDLKEPGGLLRPGLSIKATFRPDASAASRILLPRSALDSGSVWRVGPKGTVERVPVTVQAVGPTMVEVTQGLAVGDRVVVDGFQRLRSGQKVE